MIDVRSTTLHDDNHGAHNCCATGVISGSTHILDESKHRSSDFHSLLPINCQCSILYLLLFPRKSSDPLTWHVVPLNSSSMVFGHDDVTPKDVRIVLNVAPRTKLGCG